MSPLTSLISTSIKRPITSIMMFVAISVLGIIAWNRIPLELLPGGFSGQSLWVWIPYQGSQPRDSEQNVLLTVEDSLADIEGLKSMKGSARSGSVELQLSFHRSMPLDTAYNSVVDRMERSMVDLPEEADRYYIYKWDTSSAPIMYAGVGIEGEPQEQNKMMQNIVQRRLGRIDGVGEVRTWGTDSKNIYVGFSRDALMQHRIGSWELLQKMREDNFQMPSGRLIDNGQIHYLRSLAKYDSLQRFKETPVREGLILEDVAEINYSLSSSAAISRINGKDGAGLSIQKEADANTLETSRQILKVMSDIESDPRFPIEFHPFFDQGKLISGALDDLKEAALTGGIFAIIVLFMFLRNVTMTFLIAACIPFTIVASVSALYLGGGSLNLLSLMGLMIAVGMVVDNAIVVVEAIYARRVDGEEKLQAAVQGASEVALAITLSTITTLAVFLPVILMNRDTDYAFFLGEIGFPISWALGASLLVALAFTPLTTTLLRARKGDTLFVPKWITLLTTWYRKLLTRVLSRPVDAVIALGLILTITVTGPVQQVGCDPGENSGFSEFNIRYELPPQFDYYQRVEMIEKVESYIVENQENWSVKTYVSNLGYHSSRGRTTVYLDQESGPIDEDTILEEARRGLPDLPGVRLSIGWDGNRDNQQFQLYLRGDNTEKLEEIAHKVAGRIEQVEGVLSVDYAAQDSSMPEIQLHVNRAAAARYQVDPSAIGFTVSSVLGSNRLPDQTIDKNNVAVLARFRYEDRANLDRLLNFPAFSETTGQTVPLKQLVDVKMAPSLKRIERTNRQSSYPLQINSDKSREISELRVETAAMLSAMTFPPGYGFDPPFDPDTQADKSAMRNSIVMSILLVFLIMGALFESFLLPLAILTTIPMAALGAYWSLYVTSTPLDSIAAIGFIILIGVVVNNGIVLVELVTRLRRDGMSREKALIEASSRRLRPILMTAMTTIFGILPMAYGGSGNSGISYTPMGRVVVGGLTAGTLLTLFMVPVLYSMLDNLRLRYAQIRQWTKVTTKPMEEIAK